jgi:hypothetical protein
VAEKVNFGFAVSTLRRNSAMLAFPVLSAAVVAVATLVILAPVAFHLGSQVVAGVEQPQLGALDIALLVVSFLVNAAVVAFFSGALTSEALVVIKGGHASVGHGFGAAASRLPQLMAWGLVTSTIGLLLRALRERAGIAGALLAIIGGIAWGIATVFVLPVIMVEGRYPLPAIRRSIEVLKTFFGPGVALKGLRRAWGYGVGYLLLTIGGIVLGVVLIVIGAMAFSSSQPVLGVPPIIGGVLVFGLVAVVQSALGAMVSAVLYVFATESTTPEGVDQTLLRRGFASR